MSYALSAILPEMGPLSRARWAHVFAGDADTLHTAMSLEQVMDEASFVVGPVLGVMLSTLWFPEAGLLVAFAPLLFGHGRLRLGARDRAAGRASRGPSRRVCRAPAGNARRRRRARHGRRDLRRQRGCRRRGRQSGWK
ncbi:MAG: hypothetical protein V9F04_15690 [Dermatophilaceae bacterium]